MLERVVAVRFGESCCGTFWRELLKVAVRVGKNRVAQSYAWKKNES